MLPEYNTSMILTELPERREVELTINSVFVDDLWKDIDPRNYLTHTLFYDMTADIPQDLNPAYYWAMVLSYVVRIDEGEPRLYTGGLGPRSYTTEWLDNDEPVPIRYWVLPPEQAPLGIYDLHNEYGLAAILLGHDPTQAPSPVIQQILTQGGYGWGYVQTPTVVLFDSPPPIQETGSYEVYYEPGMSHRYFGRYMLFWRKFETGDGAGGVFYDITDPKFEATLRRQFSPITISSNAISETGYERPKQVRIISEHSWLRDPWNLTVEDRRVIFIPFAGPSTLEAALGPNGAVPKSRGVSGDKRQ